MKKILIIDKLGLKNQPDFSRYNCVTFMEECNCENSIDPEKYSAVFVHQKNTNEVNWSKKRMDVVVVFSGGFTQLVNVKGQRFNVPKFLYDQNLLTVLDSFVISEIVDPNKFLM